MKQLIQRKSYLLCSQAFDEEWFRDVGFSGFHVIVFDW